MSMSISIAPSISYGNRYDSHVLHPFPSSARCGDGVSETSLWSDIFDLLGGTKLADLPVLLEQSLFLRHSVANTRPGDMHVNKGRGAGMES